MSPLHGRSPGGPHDADDVYASTDLSVSAPTRRFPDGEIDPRHAYAIVHDELMLEGNPRLNLATFCSTWLEPEVHALMSEAIGRNIVDKDEYPQTAEIEARCVRMLADLWNAPPSANPMGTSTTGSSEAAMLAGMALKWRWRARQESAGKPTSKPNLVMGSNVQVCWEKFCRYWEVEPRLVPMEGERYHMTAEPALPFCDENTIGMIPVLGSTFDGSYEPVAEICAALDKLEADTGLDIPVHVDAASGGFVAPFIDPDLVWDFRLPRVQSINASGHKYGLVYPGVGWVVWRNPEALPDDLVFNVNYLGGNMPTFALNFSRPGSQIVAQYYNFIRLGFDGYRRVQQAARDIATDLARDIAELGHFELITDGSELPVFAFRMADGIANYTVFHVVQVMRERGWLLPAYTFPENRQDLGAIRIVVRNGFTRDLGELLLADLKLAVEYLDQLKEPLPPKLGAGFKH